MTIMQKGKMSKIFTSKLKNKTNLKFEYKNSVKKLK